MIPIHEHGKRLLIERAQPLQQNFVANAWGRRRLSLLTRGAASANARRLLRDVTLGLVHRFRKDETEETLAELARRNQQHKGAKKLSVATGLVMRVSDQR